MEHKARRKRAPGLLDPGAPIKPNRDDNCLTLPNAGKNGKSTRRAKVTDRWVEARIHWLAAELTRLEGGPVAKLHLKKALAAYRQYRRFGSARQRYLSWSFLDQVAVQLVGRESRSSDQLQGQEAA